MVRWHARHVCTQRHLTACGHVTAVYLSGHTILDRIVLMATWLPRWCANEDLNVDSVIRQRLIAELAAESCVVLKNNEMHQTRAVLHVDFTRLRLKS